MFITEDDYKVVIGDTAMKVVSQASAENRAKIYYLDITDEGSNYNSIFTLFNGLRDAEAPVQYRVRNGLDSEQSAQTGIYSMSYYIGEQLIKK